MLIDQLIRLSPEDDAEIVKAKNDSFDLMARRQLDHHMLSVSPDTIKKLVLDIDLILHHSLLSSSRKDLTSRNILSRSMDTSRQQTSESALNQVH